MTLVKTKNNLEIIEGYEAFGIAVLLKITILAHELSYRTELLFLYFLSNFIHQFDLALVFPLCAYDSILVFVIEHEARCIFHPW